MQNHETYNADVKCTMIIEADTYIEYCYVINKSYSLEEQGVVEEFDASYCFGMRVYPSREQVEFIIGNPFSDKIAKSNVVELTNYICSHTLFNVNELLFSEEETLRLLGVKLMSYKDYPKTTKKKREICETKNRRISRRN